MPETGQITFSHKEIVETLVKRQGIHNGIWGLFVKFGLAAANIGQTETEIVPAAVIPVLQLGLQRFDKESAIAVDAAKVNPDLKAKKKNRKK